jgi:S1-C subfamily serine protease
MSTFKDLSDAMAEAVETVSVSLVQVNARRRLPATGIVWSAEGVIVTTNHVVERDEDITITLDDGTAHEATLIGRDPANDLAVLKVDASLTPASWADDDSLKVGNLVLALGHPSEETQASLGVVSALFSEVTKRKRRPHKQGHRFSNGRFRKRGGGRRMWKVIGSGHIRTDVVMYPGFSGGALITGDGLVHGVNTSGFGQGASVTIPVATIRNTVETLQKHGKMTHGYIGIGIQPARLPDAVKEELEQEVGLLIVSVENDSPASKAGLMVGDTVVTIDDDPIEQLEDLLSAQKLQVGKTVSAQIVRGGALQHIDVTIGERPS